MKTIKLIIITICIVCIAMLCACSSSGSGGGNSSTSATLSAIGGTGSNGIGGTGGEFYIESDAAIKVLKSGSADASFTMPDTSTYNFGANGYTVSGSEQILLDTAVPAGYTGLYVIDNYTHGTPDNWNLYKADGTGSAGIPGGYGTSSPVTGLSVPSGATLTISADSYWYSSEYAGAYITLTNDVVIDGTLQTAAGYNYIWFDNSSSYTASLPANIVVMGTVTTSGAENGWIAFEAGKHIYNNGTLDASGSDNSTGNGNDSEGIWLDAYTGSVYSKGTIKSDGGNGGNGSGGAGAYYIEIIGGYAEDTYVDPLNGGSVILGGTVEAKGGNAGGTAGGNGGVGGGGLGFSYIVALGGDLIVNATFTLNGGNGSGSGYGGDAKGIDFYVFGMDYRRVGVCQISGSFNLNGGNGVTGGAGGYIDFYSYNWDDGNFGTEDTGNGVGQAPDMQLLGFSSINLNGGNGTTAGGNAKNDAYELYTYAPWDDYDLYYLPAYPIVSEANVSAKGGNASAASGTGGNGGFADIEVDEEDYYYNQTGIAATELITQSGTIDISGGNATASGGTGGAGGTIYLDNSGYDYTTTTGILTANGGNGALQGGNGGYIKFNSDVTNAVYTLANLSVTGGTGTTAGSSGTAYVNGTQVLP